MKTIYASLPFYDSVDKQDSNRSAATQHFHCPTNELPSFLINCESDTIATVGVYLVACDDTETDITSYLPSDPYEVVVGTDSYLQYDGGVLLDELPMGTYHLRVVTSGVSYYSEHIMISEIYENLITGWTNELYGTFTASGTSITSAISDGTLYRGAQTGAFTIRKGQSVRVYTHLTLNSGKAPYIYLTGASGAGVKSNVVILASGANNVTLTATEDGSCKLAIANDLNASNFSTSDFFVFWPYSENFVSLRFSNTNDLGDILYSTTFEQKVWLETKLTTPDSEAIEVGEEKDGIFIAEKITTKYIHRLIAYVPRALHRCLIRLPQHDTIEITDEVGNVYRPAVGNVQVLSEPELFGTMKVTIRFNEDPFNWTYDMDNIT